jgi:hypothetical protein
MPEISDTELVVLQRGKQLLDRLWNDPEEGMAFKEKVRKIIPNASIPELDIVKTATKPLTERLSRQEEENKALKDRLDKWEQRSKDSDEETKISQMLEEVRSKFHFTDAGMEKVVSRMREKSNPDAEAAAAWVASQEKKAKPITTGISSSNLNLYGSNKEEESYKELNLNPEKWAVEQMEQMMNEFSEQDAA